MKIKALRFEHLQSLVFMMALKSVTNFTKQDETSKDQCVFLSTGDEGERTSNTHVVQGSSLHGM